MKKRYEPKTPGTERALLKTIINNPQSKRVNEVEPSLIHAEELIKKYKLVADTNLPEDLKVTILIDLCHKDLREHLELSTNDSDPKEVRDEILNYVERKRDTMNNTLSTALTNGLGQMRRILLIIMRILARNLRPAGRI